MNEQSLNTGIDDKESVSLAPGPGPNGHSLNTGFNGDGEQNMIVDDENNSLSHWLGVNGHSLNSGSNEDGEQIIMIDDDDRLSCDPLHKHPLNTGSDGDGENSIVIDGAEKASRPGLNGHPLDTDSNGDGEQNVLGDNENVSRDPDLGLNRRYVEDSEGNSTDNEGPGPQGHSLNNGSNLDGDQIIVIHDDEQPSSNPGPGVNGHSLNIGSRGEDEQAIVINDDKNASLDPRSGPNGQPLNAGSNGDGECGDGERLLWSGQPRRTTFKPSAAPQKLFTETRIYLLAMVLSGAAGSEGSVWPEQNPSWLSDQMKRAWITMANRMESKEVEDHHVTAEPTPEDARKVGLISFHVSQSDMYSFTMQLVTGGLVPLKRSGLSLKSFTLGPNVRRTTVSSACVKRY